MTKTFNIEIWQQLKQDFTDLSEKIYFGEVPEEIDAPFAVLHVLDNGEDNTYKTLCNDDKVYRTDIQINIYAANDMYIDELLDNLNTLIDDLKILQDYRIINKERQRTRNANGFSSELGMGYTEYIFTYEKL